MCSPHPDGVSQVPSCSASLVEFLEKDPSVLGSHVLQTTAGKAELPILIKLIDAKTDISVQVHPDDAYAMRVEQSRGKTECWYILDAKPGARLIYGFKGMWMNRKLKLPLLMGQSWAY